MKTALLVLCSTLAAITMGQIQGDTVVCAGNTYTYTADIPSAVNYDWEFPNGWYEASGLGTSGVTVTCNLSSGDVCVTGVDDIGNAIGQYCIPTEFGGGGSGFDLQPANTSACEPFGFPTEVNFIMVPNGTGGGCEDCGGSPHPNIDQALYDNSDFSIAQFVAFLNGNPVLIQPPGGTYTVFTVDHTNGTDNASAVMISGGCGGSGNGTANVIVNAIQYPVFVQSPQEACFGETVTVYVTNSMGGSWFNFTDMDVLSDGNPLVAVVNGPNATAQYNGLDAVGCPLEDAGHAILYCTPTSLHEVASIPLALLSTGEHAYTIAGTMVSDVKVLSLRGEVLMRGRAQHIDLTPYAPGVYVLQASTPDGTSAWWKVVR